MSSDQGPSAEITELRQRLDLLERQNQRLRERIEPLAGPDNPCFDQRRFLRILNRTMAMLMAPVWLATFALLPLGTILHRVLPPITIGGLPLVDVAGIGTRHPGLGIGVLGVGGIGIGLIGIGGLGVGVIAAGGGAIGVIALGGGSIGLIAFGGGAIGLIAVGGGACGKYVFAQRGWGKFVFAINRQDDEAVEFFCRYLPSLRSAVTQPMPVIFVPKNDEKNTEERVG
jgi:hypothetical protein